MSDEKMNILQEEVSSMSFYSTILIQPPKKLTENEHTMIP